MPKKIKVAKAWAGVVDDKIHCWMNAEPSYYEVYRRRADAKKHYERIVRVEIRPVAR